MFESFINDHVSKPQECYWRQITNDLQMSIVVYRQSFGDFCGKGFPTPKE